ncbi:MAG: leucine-rich repeat domain-containing protein, partial [Prevotella sp.]|nr:leucine-rich repeat domain-containing protein [Prevotella sp.]
KASFNGTDVTNIFVRNANYDNDDGTLCYIYEVRGYEQFATSGTWVVVFKQVGGSASSDIIEFADANVEAICVENWDTNGDGKLSKTEAAAVTSLLVANDSGETESVFKSNTTITSFDELEYFTGLTELGTGSFRGCTSLSSIHLPSTIKTLGRTCFEQCSSLKEIYLPEGLETISDWTFGSSGLRTIYIPKNVSTVGRCSFSSCADLTSIVVDPDNSTFASPDACNGIINKNTKTLVVGTRYTRIPEGIINIGNVSYAFDKQIESVEIPSTVTSLIIQAFYGCTNLKHVISKANTPPSFNANYSFNGISDNCVLTVPYGTRDAYIAAGWTTDIFKGGIVEDKSQYDTNKDGSITIADVTKLVNIILGKE